MGVLGKDLLDFHRPCTNTKVEVGASRYSAHFPSDDAALRRCADGNSES